MRDFCCHGCQTVCTTIYESGMQSVYQRAPGDIALSPPPEQLQALESYDIPEVQQNLVKSDGANRDAHLLVEGIHCAACVWLIENSLRRVPGVRQASVNLANKRLHLVWDSEQTNLSDLLRRLESIGYAAVPYNPETAVGALHRTNRAMIYRLSFAGFAMMNLMWISIALYSGANRGEFRDFFHWMGLMVATPTLLYAGYPFYRNSWYGLKSGQLTMDLPIAIGLGVTYCYSLFVTLSGSRTGEVYFDTVTNLIFVILIGRYLEGMYRQQAVSSTQRLMDFQPNVATVQRDGEEVTVPIRSVLVGERVVIRPGQKVPVDGVVLQGESAVDESMLSGESVAVGKYQGDKVSAGTLNTHGLLIVQVACGLQDTVLARIIRTVEEAQASKAPVQRLADRIVPWFVLVTLTLAACTFFAWQGQNFELALMAATSVMIITCPCALGMATPMSIAVASGLAARHGILIKNGLVLETLSKVTHFVFDKTGTLTEGKMRVCRVLSAQGGEDADALLALAAAVERCSEHHVARAIVREADSRLPKSKGPEATRFTSVPGLGVKAEVDGQEVLLGTAAWLAQHQIALNAEFKSDMETMENQAMSGIHMAVAGHHVAVFGLADRLRPDALALVTALRQAGIRMTLLSGDKRAVAEAVAEQLGGMQVIAEVLPHDKDRVLKELQQKGECVAMVGDGVNDAPALIRADVGIALGSGMDVSVECADVVLMNSELDKVRLAVALSRRTLSTIKQNMGIAFVYNLTMVPLAMMAVVTPLVAALTMPVSSLLVVANAARIRKVFPREACKAQGTQNDHTGQVRLANRSA
jgi:Cu2+-exporting ATPase